MYGYFVDCRKKYILMNKLFITICCVLITTLGYSQQVSVTEKTIAREDFYNKEYADYWRVDDSCDTLLLEDGTPALLLRTPIRYIDGYTGLFRTHESIYDCEVLFTEHSGLGARGYFMTWRLKDKKIYLEKVWWNRIELFEADNDGNLKPRRGPDVSPEEIKKRVELLTSRKFNEEGLLFADWVTDRVFITKYHPYRRTKESLDMLIQPLDEILSNSNTYLSKTAGVDKMCEEVSIFNRTQKIFALDFIKGELRQIYEYVNISQGQLLNDLDEKTR